MGYRTDRYAADPTVFTASTTLRKSILHKFSTAAGGVSQTLPQASTFLPGGAGAEQGWTQTNMSNLKTFFAI
jgi:hypothetical protein